MAQDPRGKLKLGVLVGHEVLHCVNIKNAPCSMTGEGGSPKGDPVEISEYPSESCKACRSCLYFHSHAYPREQMGRGGGRHQQGIEIINVGK